MWFYREYNAAKDAIKEDKKTCPKEEAVIYLQSPEIAAKCQEADKAFEELDGKKVKNLTVTASYGRAKRKGKKWMNVR